MLRFFRIYLLPGAILQSVNIGGGYGTGRELVEFFTRHGMGNGLSGMLLATVCMSLTFALSLSFATRFRVYDYRSFFKLLIGRYWFLFEILGVTLFVVVLAVMGAAAGAILNQQLGVPPLTGGVLMLTAVVTLNYFGREWVTRVLASWSVLLYAVFISYFVAVLADPNHVFDPVALEFSLNGDWLVSALQYALYNVSAIPIILYAARAIETQRQAAISGLVGGLVTMFPGILFHISFAGAYPAVLSESLPVYYMFDNLSLPLLQACYLVMLFGTFVETGAGNMQGFIERLDTWWTERTGHALSRLQHAGFAGTALLVAGALSSIGIVNLIAEGYGTLAWGYLAIYLIPLFTLGLARLRRAGPVAGQTAI